MKKLLIITMLVGLAACGEEKTNSSLSLASFCERAEHSKVVCECIKKRGANALGEDAKAFFKVINDPKTETAGFEIFDEINIGQMMMFGLVVENCEKEHNVERPPRGER